MRDRFHADENWKRRNVTDALRFMRLIGVIGKGVELDQPISIVFYSVTTPHPSKFLLFLADHYLFVPLSLLVRIALGQGRTKARFDIAGETS